MRTLLFMAAKYGHEPVIELILDTYGIYSDVKDDFGQTPLLVAAEKGHEPVVKLLLAMDTVDRNPRK